jgi:hypothetical protein
MIFETGNLHPNTPHLFADLAELLLLSKSIGRDSLHKNDLEALITNGVVSADEIDDEDASENTARLTHQSTAERSSRIENQLEDVMIQLEYRSRSLADYYPFSLSGEALSFTEPLSDRARVYRMLLSCSRLRSFKKTGIPQRWAKHFSKLSKIALTSLVPSHASVRIFDANSDDRKEYYSTDLREALKILGKDLGVLTVHENECHKAGPSGDAGLDLVAIIDFEDDAAVNYALLAQCGAQETGWPNKTLEAHSLKYRHCFHMQFDYPGIMFTPVFYRDSQGAWLDNQSTNGILLIDRLRMLKLIALQDQWASIVSAPWFTEFETEFAEMFTANMDE